MANSAMRSNRAIRSALEGLSESEKRELLARLLREKAASAQKAAQDDAPSEFPLSAGQQGLWYASLRDPSLTAYNVFLSSRYRDPIDLTALEKTIEELARRHVALRTSFAESPSGGEPVQRRQVFSVARISSR